MKIFMTGGTGFIGSYVLRDALAAGHDVLALRRSCNSEPAIKLPSEPQWVERDLLDLTAGDLQGCTVVAHLASAGVSPQIVTWNELIRVNVIGSAHLIEISSDAGVKRMVAAGTCHEYGEVVNTTNELTTCQPLNPLNLYGASKAASYHLLSAYARSHEIELYYARIYNVFGDGQYEKNFWPSLRKAALEGSDFAMSSGEQLCDFVPVEEVAQALLGACLRTFTEADYPVVENITTGRPQSLLSFAQQQWVKLGGTGKLLPGALADR